MALLLSWNCRGLRNKVDEIKHLISDHHPVCIALQETFMHSTHTCKIRGYNYTQKTCHSSGRASGGVAFLISNRIPSNTLTLNTNLQAIAAQIHIGQLITICNIYLPPNETINQELLENLINQLPTPLLIFGDFNAHSSIWGSRDTNPRGRMIENFIADNCLCLLNNGDHTYFHEPSKTYHTLDLALCSASILPFFHFWVGNDLRGSDHFPICLSHCTRNSNLNSRLPHFITKAADWSAFGNLATITNDMVNGDIDQVISNITNKIIHAAERAIPKSSSLPRKVSRPWWTDECRNFKKKQQKAWGYFRRYPTDNNYISYKRARAEYRKIRRKCQRESWIRYVSSITASTPSKTLWNRVKRAMGLYSDFHVSTIIDNGQTFADLHDITNAIANSLSTISNANNYPDSFLKYKRTAESQPLNFATGSDLPYNSPFTINELIYHLKKATNTSPGPDHITYDMLKHLSRSSILNLLKIYNRIWEERIFPNAWYEAIVIPFPKPGRDPRNPKNYRPIALTSCLCKLFEKMVNARLVYVLETKNILSPHQSGFRRGRTTLDNIMLLETNIRNAFLRRNHLISIFFDIEKAYDRTWRYGILRDLFNFDFRGNLPIFIKNFLAGRNFKVRIGNVLSNTFTQEEGVPQGSVLSVTLFSIKINNILSVLPPTVHGSLYVDDLQISCQGKDIRYIERQLQTTVNRIIRWTYENGFNISLDKTTCVHFSRRRGLFLEPNILIGTNKINVADTARFLGVTLDKKLNFHAHIAHLRKKCEKGLNLLKVLSNTSWGAEKTSMLKIYRSMIRSKLDYACPVYGSARASALRRLDTVHHSALRICSGAFRTSPVQSLYADCLEPSLSLTRRCISMKYFFRILSHSSHPLNQIILDTSSDRLYTNRPSLIPPFGLRMRSQICNTKLANVDVSNCPLFSLPPWRSQKVTFIYPFKNLNKDNTNNKIYCHLFAAHRNEYPNFAEIYTDGSKSDNHVGFAYSCDNRTISFKLPDHCSIYTAEFIAIKEALLHISKRARNNYIIYSDSQSVLTSLRSYHIDHPLAIAVLDLHRRLLHRGFNILFCWVPSHVGIAGNEIVDKAAKNSHNVLNHPIPYSDLKWAIKQSIFNSWNEDWNNMIDNKLHMIKPTICAWNNLSHRKLDVILTRLRIGHTRLTHCYLLTRETAPSCNFCHSPLTIRHVLTSCSQFHNLYIKHFHTSSPDIISILGDPHDPHLFDFIKDAGLFSEI